MDYLNFLLSIAGKEKFDALFSEIQKTDISDLSDACLPERDLSEKMIPAGEMSLFEKQAFAYSVRKEKEYYDFCEKCELKDFPNHACPHREIIDLRLDLDLTRELMWDSIRKRFNSVADLGIRKGFVIVETAPQVEIAGMGGLLAAALIEALARAMKEKTEAERQEEEKDTGGGKGGNIIWH